MGHERSAAHVAMRAINLLPQMLDASRILAIQQFKNRERASVAATLVQLIDLAPARDAVVRVPILRDTLRLTGVAVRRVILMLLVRSATAAGAGRVESARASRLVGLRGRPQSVRGKLPAVIAPRVVNQSRRVVMRGSRRC